MEHGASLEIKSDRTGRFGRARNNGAAEPALEPDGRKERARGLTAVVRPTGRRGRGAMTEWQHALLVKVIIVLIVFPALVMAFSMLLRRMKVKVTAHGFRSSFRDWAAERTAIPHEVAEMALAHAIGSKTEAAYRRGDLFEKRRQLMSAWADFLSEPRNRVVKLRATVG